MKTNGNQWKPMETNENQWTIIGINGESMETNDKTMEIPWKIPWPSRSLAGSKSSGVTGATVPDGQLGHVGFEPTIFPWKFVDVSWDFSWILVVIFVVFFWEFNVV